MKEAAAILWVVLAGLLVGCGYNASDVQTTERIQELEDSLKAYRDSLKDAQLAFSFNAVTAVVKLQDYKVRLGDSCRAEILIGAANTPDAVAEGFAYGDADLEISGLPNSRITRSDTRWLVTFLPERMGTDSLLGTIVLHGRRGASEKLEFGALYEVVER